jgi:large subunit ribosomal protein L19
MSHIAIQEIEKKFINKKVPVLRPGYTVKVHHKIKEGEKERVQVFEGLVIALNSGHGGSKMVTVRKVVEGIGVEKIFPMYSPVIAKIEVTKTPSVRRAKLYYMRGLAGKSTRLKNKLGMSEKDQQYSKKRGELMEAMGVENVAAPEEQAENQKPEPKVEETAPEAKTEEAAK